MWVFVPVRTMVQIFVLVRSVVPVYRYGVPVLQSLVKMEPLPVDGRRPPQREPPVGDLVEAGPLRVGQLLVLHRLLEAGRLLPEQALPRGEVGALEVV